MLQNVCAQAYDANGTERGNYMLRVDDENGIIKWPRQNSLQGFVGQEIEGTQLHIHTNQQDGSGSLRINLAHPVHLIRPSMSWSQHVSRAMLHCACSSVHMSSRLPGGAHFSSTVLHHARACTHICTHTHASTHT
eukprot:1157812-Pelagomonas_calceolata.AAC.5